ncbi:type IV secretory system conjugative DNA transfer family protein [Aeromonas veronii]|uniref:type IV secretory system conjugative DNA transfer family protein n=1 Tax=Aeromonas veronii TaxID=654 RepID=UPI0023E3E161|nr:type IV secretory system conjugative DNA transfer family protein [Aeromonas veronii]
MTLEEAQRLYDRPAYVQSAGSQDAATLTDAMKAQKNEAAKARSQAILDTALGLGVKAGMAWQLRNIDEAVKRRQREFDTVYDFGHLMIQDRVVPRHHGGTRSLQPRRRLRSAPVGCLLQDRVPSPFLFCRSQLAGVSDVSKA